MALTVKFAVYGALEGGHSDRTKAMSIKYQLQRALDASSTGLVRIDNKLAERDPCHGYEKHFGALVDVHGDDRWFACQEGQEIDFT